MQMKIYLLIWGKIYGMLIRTQIDYILDYIEVQSARK